MALIDDLVIEREQAWIDVRRDIHRNPELGFTELRTASIVAERLTHLGFDVAIGPEVMRPESMMGVPGEEQLRERAGELDGNNVTSAWLERMPGGQTGVVATLHRGDGPVVAYRFDMDALPILETGERAKSSGYMSCRHGVHHACGHDGHTAIGLGFAEWLKHDESPWCGTAKLVFQPAEEGGRGAAPMADAGVVDDAQWLFAAHLGVGLPSRHIAGASRGMLNSSKLNARFLGEPAHAGANPENGRNAILAAATATLNLHAISRAASGATRVNVGRIEGGSARNIIADDCALELEVRGESEAAAEYMERRARTILEAAATMHDVLVEITVVGQTVMPVQDDAAVDAVMAVASRTPGVDKVVREFRCTGGEDAPFLMRRVQARGGRACYFLIGADLTDFHHTADFDFDEASIATGVRMFSGLAEHLSNIQVD